MVQRRTVANLLTRKKGQKILASDYNAMARAARGDRINSAGGGLGESDERGAGGDSHGRRERPTWHCVNELGDQNIPPYSVFGIQPLATAIFNPMYIRALSTNVSPIWFTNEDRDITNGGTAEVIPIDQYKPVLLQFDDIFGTPVVGSIMEPVDPAVVDAVEPPEDRKYYRARVSEVAGAGPFVAVSEPVPDSFVPMVWVAINGTNPDNVFGLATADRTGPSTFLDPPTAGQIDVHERDAADFDKPKPTGNTADYFIHDPTLIIATDSYMLIDYRGNILWVGCPSRNELIELAIINGTGGDFTLVLFSEESGVIAEGDSVATVQAVFDAMAVFDPGDIIVSSNGSGNLDIANPMNLEFAGQYATLDVPLPLVGENDLTPAPASEPQLTELEKGCCL